MSVKVLKGEGLEGWFGWGRVGGFIFIFLLIKMLKTIKKCRKEKSFVWMDNQEEAFQTLKDLLC